MASNRGSSSNNDHPTPTNNKPSMVFLPAFSIEKIVVTGSAALGKVGLSIGSVDILESDDSYMFRVALPGVDQDNETFKWRIEPDGELFIKGVTTTVEKTFIRHGMEFKRYTDNLSPPGEFSISFKLPGPVDPQGIQLGSGSDGVFEGMVKKVAAMGVISV